MQSFSQTQALPPRFRAGDVFARSVSVPGAATAFLILTGVIQGTPTRIRIGGDDGVAVNDAGLAAFSATSGDTGAWAPGRYQWVLFGVDADGGRAEVAQGVIRIEPDPAGVTVADPRSYNEKVLDQIRNLIVGKALDDVAMYKIGGRELTKIPIADLTKWEADFERRVRNERIRRGERVPTKTVGITFGGR